MEKIITAILPLITFLLVGLIVGFFIMLLWNWLMPDIFGIKEITYWQGLGMFLLSDILFKSNTKRISDEK